MNRKVIEVLDAADLERVCAELGPLLPASTAAAMSGRTRQALFDRLRRRTMTRVLVFGLVLVPVREVPPCQLVK